MGSRVSQIGFTPLSPPLERGEIRTSSSLGKGGDSDFQFPWKGGRSDFQFPWKGGRSDFQFPWKGGRSDFQFPWKGGRSDFQFPWKGGRSDFQFPPLSKVRVRVGWKPRKNLNRSAISDLCVHRRIRSREKS
ncbi:hypothetical protein WA1_31780 [Scytonema hofmannii PCC 7110]|uniref:Uncharacterized protein n=1 Tax=Scytonema hofmannii PCC 7110 TaxID=128403 RepID=A0A139X3P5_9CYAN|nr:hypothetical protein WA1_31780 [Scytonema hofmannii PCC 7110]